MRLAWDVGNVVILPNYREGIYAAAGINSEHRIVRAARRSYCRTPAAWRLPLKPDRVRAAVIVGRVVRLTRFACRVQVRSGNRTNTADQHARVSEIVVVIRRQR